MKVRKNKVKILLILAVFRDDDIGKLVKKLGSYSNVVRAFKDIIAQGYADKASDIHASPFVWLTLKGEKFLQKTKPKIYESLIKSI